MRFNTTAFADGNCAWRSEAFRLGLRFESACHQQKVFVRNIHDHMDAGTQVLDPSWLELKRFLGNKFPVSQSVSKWQAAEGLIQLYLTLSFNLSTLPTVGDACPTPNKFYSALKTLLKTTQLSNAQKEKPLTCKP